MKNTSMCIYISLYLIFSTATLYAVTHEWTEQIGLTDAYWSFGVSADGQGNVYISGRTGDALFLPNAGSSSAFVIKYDAQGNLLWTEELGSTSPYESYGVSADGLGNVYITGSTIGDLSGPNAGSIDAFVSKYNDGGNLLWTEQLGSTSIDESFGVSADGLGNVYISGSTNGDLGGPNAGGSDAFVSKYDDGGNLLWTEQLGSTGTDRSFDVSADGLGNVYITGRTDSNLGGPNAGGSDAFVSKYGDGGNLLWTEQLGSTSSEYSYGVSADGLGNVYISGWTEGDLGGPNAGFADAFVSKYDDGGNLLWIEQLGSTSFEESSGVSADGLGNVYISGYTTGDLGGPNDGFVYAFVSKYDDGGNLLWTEQLGSTSEYLSFGVSADGLGNVYISGYTTGDLGGPNDGGLEAFIAKYSEATTIPEPSTFVIGMLAAVGLTMRRRV